MGDLYEREELFKFLERINPALLTLYPIQLANIERVEKNDAVFIFDEVGCGKTISSGLMALSYLEHHEEKKVLVITINSLVKTGQFKNDWFDRLPFTDEQKKRVTVVNDNMNKIERQKDTEWGLIVIDEAQLFLSDVETQKKRALENLRAEKVVFLTATPIRKDEEDLKKYIDIAYKIMQKKESLKISGEDYSQTDWIEKIYRILADAIKGKENTEENICARFDPALPVTRYFKDTVRFLERSSESDLQRVASEKKSKRRFAEIWKMSDSPTRNAQTKEECLFLRMNEILEKENEHRFVVFATKTQAEQLGEHFSKKGFMNYNDENNTGSRTYKVVTGDNSEELGKLGGKNAPTPTVLFVNYQVAEQGVNLPGFDYIVNFQISRFPSRLEQRFGRIDRLDKNGMGKYDAINVCYVLNDRRFDSSTINFQFAMTAYMESVLPYLPSRNMILNKNVLSYLATELIAYEELLSGIYEKLKRGECLSKDESEWLGQQKKAAEEEGIEKEINLEQIERLLKSIERDKQRLEEIKKLDSCNHILGDLEVSDGIFVKYGDQGHIKTITNVECAESILDCEEYKNYCKILDARFLAILYKKYELYKQQISHAINSYLAAAFAMGELDWIYPRDGYKRLMRRILRVGSEQYEDKILYIDNNKGDSKKGQIRYMCLANGLRYSMRKWGELEIVLDWTPVGELKDADKTFLIEHAEEFLCELPIYQYLREVGKELFVFNGDKYDNGTLKGWETKENATYKCWKKCMYDGEHWRYYVKAADDRWEPSPFLKLFYHFMRPESLLITYTPENYECYKRDCERETECISLLEDFLDYTEMNDSREKEEKKESIEKKIEKINELNHSLRKWNGYEVHRCTHSWFGQIFNESKLKRRANWKIKNIEYIRKNWDSLSNDDGKCPDVQWYATNKMSVNLKLLLYDLLYKSTFKKKLDYWSYNLIQEMLYVEDYVSVNKEIGKIFPKDGCDKDSDYGFDYDAIGIRKEILCGSDGELAKKVLTVLDPWLRGKY